MFVAARLGSQSQIHTRTGVVYLGYRDNHDQGEYHSVVGPWVPAPQYLCDACAGEKRLPMPNMYCLGRLHGGSLKRVDDERQLLMRWGSTSVALSQPASSAPPIKFCTKNISWIDGIWSPSPTAHLFFGHQPSGLFYLGLILVLT
jgi:hypothetical protein